MANFFNHYIPNRLLHSILLLAFTLSYSLPTYSIEQIHINNVNALFKEAAFVVRIEKLIEKLKKSEERGIDYMIKTLVKVINEIEVTYNTGINIDNYFRDIKKELKEHDLPIPTIELEFLRKKLKKEDKAFKKHAQLIANVMNAEGYGQFEEIDDYDFLAKHKDKKDKEESEEEEIEIPTMLVYGVTLSLCGMFMMVIPIPICKEWGGKLVLMGVSACAGVLAPNYDEQKKKDKNKDKKE